MNGTVLPNARCLYLAIYAYLVWDGYSWVEILGVIGLEATMFILWIERVALLIVFGR